jgi:hypothetical protein
MGDERSRSAIHLHSASLTWVERRHASLKFELGGVRAGY